MTSSATHFRSLVVAGATVIAGASAVHAAGDPTCPPVALVEGPTDIAAPTRAILRDHGIRSEPRTCAGRLLRASFLASPEPDEYTLRIDDGFGRLSDRRASDPETAASLIESWLLDEDAALLTPKPEPATAAPNPGPAAVAALASGPALTAAAPLAGWRLFGAGELWTDAGDTRWQGGSAGACRSFGPICIGGRARLLQAQQWQSPYGTTRDETGADALTLAAMPLRLGRVTFLPTAGVGLGFTRFVRVRDWETTSRERLFVRGDLSLIVDVVVARGWSVFAEVGTSAAQQIAGGLREGQFGPDPLRRDSDVALRTGIGVGYSP